MAYTTTQIIDQLKVDNLIFVPSNNQNISSGYSLYINATGQLYWAAALDANSLSTFSTSVYNYINYNNAIFSTSINLLNIQVSQQSSTISTVSSDFASLSTLLPTELSNFYESTIFIMTSTLYGFSSLSSFYFEIYALSNIIESGLSSLSTAIFIQNTSTYDSLVELINESQQLCIDYTTASIQELSSIVAHQEDLSTFSSVITSQLLSTTAGAPSLISSQFGPINYSISTLTISTNQLLSTTSSLEQQVSDLQQFSTSISSVTYAWISSYVSTSQGLQNIDIYKSISSLSTVIGSNQNSTIIIISQLSTYISSVANLFVNNNDAISTLNGEVNYLNSQLYVLSTNYILKGIFDSFVQLEEYSTEILTSTFSSIYVFYSTIAYSTYTQNISIANAFYDALGPQISSFFNSTIFAYSTFVSTLNFYFFASSTITLANNQYKGLLDFSKYRNFYVNVYNISNGPSNYSLTYDQESLFNLDYYRGIIFINVSTPTQTYTRNQGKLQFDVFRWGIPTTVWGNFYPTIANSQYTLQYEYTIVNKSVYTNLMNVFPLLYVSTLTLSSYVLPMRRGSNILLSWENYNGFNPTNLSGSPPFDPTVSIEMYSNTTLMSNFGPFPFNSSTTIRMPNYNNTLFVKITGQGDEQFGKQSSIIY
jgi:hypothetical protein